MQSVVGVLLLVWRPTDEEQGCLLYTCAELLHPHISSGFDCAPALPCSLIVEQIPFFALEAGKLASDATLDINPLIFITNALAAFGELHGGWVGLKWLRGPVWFSTALPACDAWRGTGRVPKVQQHQRWQQQP